MTTPFNLMPNFVTMKLYHLITHKHTCTNKNQKPTSKNLQYFLCLLYLTPQRFIILFVYFQFQNNLNISTFADLFNSLPTIFSYAIEIFSNYFSINTASRIRHTVLYMCLKSPNFHRIFASHNLDVMLAQNFKTIEKKKLSSLIQWFLFLVKKITFILFCLFMYWIFETWILCVMDLTVLDLILQTRLALKSQTPAGLCHPECWN